MSAQAQTPPATEPELDVSQLTAALDNLTKAAASTSLHKGDIANSGTYSDGKPAGGGQGSMSDSGTVDDLMIAKMSAAGVDAGTIAGFRQFMAFEKKKKKDGDVEGNGSVPQPPFQRSAAAASDLSKSITDDPEIQEGMECSPFLESLVARTTDAVSALQKSIQTGSAGVEDFRKSQNQMNRAVAGALTEMGKLLKSQAGVIDVMTKRLGIVERAPVQNPRGRTSGAVPLNKSMPNEAGATFQPLKKSEVLSVLSYRNLEKGEKAINGISTTQLIGMYEGGGVLDDRTLENVHQWVQANPKEAELARQYA